MYRCKGGSKIEDEDSRTWLTRRRSLAIVGLALFGLLALGSTATGAGQEKKVSLNNGITLYNGAQLDTNGQDIVDAGATIWDSSAGQIPTAAINAAGLTWSDLGISKADVSKSDVGLSNVRDVDLSNTAGSFLSYSESNENYNVNSGSMSWADLGVSQSDISASDVGLGNVENIALSAAGWSDIGISQSDVSASDVSLGSVQNEAQVAENGDTMSGDLNMDGNDIDNPHIDDPFTDLEITGGENVKISAGGSGVIELDGDGNTANTECTVDGSGNINCDGSKNWVHRINSTHTATYTSQESPQVRAVFEGQTNLENGRINVSLPSHFSKTVSDTEPKLRAHATPHTLATVAVTDRSHSWIVIEASKDVKVDYRVTGIRDGYEDKKVVQRK